MPIFAKTAKTAKTAKPQKLQKSGFCKNRHFLQKILKIGVLLKSVFLLNWHFCVNWHFAKTPTFAKHNRRNQPFFGEIAITIIILKCSF
jgi:hypothetical protein